MPVVTQGSITYRSVARMEHSFDISCADYMYVWRGGKSHIRDVERAYVQPVRCGGGFRI